MQILRWILVVPSLIAGWLLFLGSGPLAAITYLYFCPSIQLEGTACFGDLHGAVLSGLIFVGTVVSAAPAIMVPICIAPTHKVKIGYVALVGPIVIIVRYLTFKSELHLSELGALVLGALLAALIQYRLVTVERTTNAA